jgi:hypothetical protein
MCQRCERPGCGEGGSLVDIALVAIANPSERVLHGWQLSKCSANNCCCASSSDSSEKIQVSKGW